MLVEYGADINIVNKDNLNSLDIAEKYSNEEIQNFIREEILKNIKKEEPTIVQATEYKASQLDKKIKDLYFSETSLFPGQPLHDIWEEAKKDKIILSETLTPSMPYIYLTSLILMDYKNVDPIAYDVLIRMIFKYNHIRDIINPFLADYKYILLTTLLFNQELEFTKEELAKIKSIISYTKNIDKDTLKGLKYWFITHPSTIKNNIESFDILTPDIEELLINYEERVKLRELTKMPF